MRNLRVWPVATALIAGVLGAPASAQAQDVPGFERMTARTVQASDEAQTAYETIAAFIEQNPARFGGVRLDGPSSLTVSLPGGTDQAQRVQVLRRLAPGLTVTVEPVSRSRAAILGVKEQIGAMIRAGAHREGIVGVGVDAVRGVVTVYATGDSAAARADLKRRFADTVVFRQMDALQPAESDRNRDTAPHYGGAGYTMWNNAHTASVPYCSLAFPVVRNGVTHGLTAGHCMPGSTGHPDAWATAFTSATPPSIGYYFGTLATTTLAGTLSNTTDGTQDVYGDWALLRGSTYYPRIYNCANVTGSCTHVPIGTASWVTPSLNASLCSSGRTTGQICRQHVADAEYEGYVGNNYTRQLAVFVRDDGGCATIRGGDSGGAIYQGMSSRPGYMRAMGVVTGVSTNGCVAVYTKLSGVRAWDPSITMPTL